MPNHASWYSWVVQVNSDNGSVLKIVQHLELNTHLHAGHSFRVHRKRTGCTIGMQCNNNVGTVGIVNQMYNESTQSQAGGVGQQMIPSPSTPSSLLMPTPPSVFLRRSRRFLLLSSLALSSSATLTSNRARKSTIPVNFSSSFFSFQPCQPLPDFLHSGFSDFPALSHRHKMLSTVKMIHKL